MENQTFEVEIVHDGDVFFKSGHYTGLETFRRFAGEPQVGKSYRVTIDSKNAVTSITKVD